MGSWSNPQILMGTPAEARSVKLLTCRTTPVSLSAVTILRISIFRSTKHAVLGLDNVVAHRSPAPQMATAGGSSLN